MNLKKTRQQLLKTLKNADVCCHDCGTKYGVYSVGCSSVWEGTCDVCKQVKPITETRDYAYLITGQRKLYQETMKTTTEALLETPKFSPEEKAIKALKESFSDIISEYLTSSLDMKEVNYLDPEMFVNCFKECLMKELEWHVKNAEQCADAIDCLK
jgi:hypothetical protein